MGIDVDEVACADARGLDGEAHGARGAFALGVGLGDVVGVGGDADAGDLGVDARSARDRVVVLLEDEAAGTLAHDEAVAGLVIRTAGGSRVVVAGRQRAHGGEGRDGDRVDAGFGAAGDDHVGAAGTDHLQADRDRFGA